ncbi:permease-like cell division protein FtsX [Nonomuraea sp. NPDC050663]|uniref:permease-like cell division protein FtsX n=1 Tax=Nonomuraea sp. NPDC050663 TaxID=3364370 RepID=UPI00378C3C00
MSDLVQETLADHPEAPTRRRRLTAVLAVVAVLLAGGGFGAWKLYSADPGLTSPPQRPWPTGGTLRVFVCAGKAEGRFCDGKVATQEQKQAVAQRLRALPGATAIRFEDQATLWANIWKPIIDAPGMPPVQMTEKDVFEAFSVKVAELSADTAATFENVPGVAGVSWRRTGFWVGVTDLRVRLCGYRTAAREGSPCEHRSLASEEEIHAIYERLRAVPGITAIYRENASHARQDLDNQSPPTSSTSGDDPGQQPGSSLHVKLDDPAMADEVKRAVAGMAGVDEVAADVDPF